MEKGYRSWYVVPNLTFAGNCDIVLLGLHLTSSKACLTILNSGEGKDIIS